MTSVVRVARAIAPVHRDALISSEQISQYLFGHQLSVLERAGAWVRVRGADAYEGWVHEGYLGENDVYGTDWRIALLSLGCTVMLPEGDSLPLPFGALVPAEFALASGEVVSAGERASRFPPDPRAIAHSAREMYAGAPYIWGGVSPWGSDCSGFSQAVFGIHGVHLPRDASQQAETGAPAGDDPLTLEAADLLFFSDRGDGAISHVAVALGEGQIAHCSLGRGGHRVEDLREPDAYIRVLLDRFRFARRVVAGQD